MEKEAEIEKQTEKEKYLEKTVIWNKIYRQVGKAATQSEKKDNKL